MRILYNSAVCILFDGAFPVSYVFFVLEVSSVYKVLWHTVSHFVEILCGVGVCEVVSFIVGLYPFAYFAVIGICVVAAVERLAVRLALKRVPIFSALFL